MDLILLRGLPGAGKSTLAETLCDVVFAADSYFMIDGEYRFKKEDLNKAHNLCAEQTEFAMKAGINIIGVANTFTKESEMQRYIESAESHGYRVHTIVVENRHGGKNNHGVPDFVIDKMRDRFEIKL